MNLRIIYKNTKGGNFYEIYSGDKVIGAIILKKNETIDSIEYMNKEELLQTKSLLDAINTFETELQTIKTKVLMKGK